MTPAARQAQEAQAVQLPYVGLAVALVLLAVIVVAVRSCRRSIPPARRTPTSPRTRCPIAAAPGSTGTSCSAPSAIFVYVGAEVAIG